jgi:hypothetical protein
MLARTIPALGISIVTTMLAHLKVTGALQDYLRHLPLAPRKPRGCTTIAREVWRRAQMSAMLDAFAPISSSDSAMMPLVFVVERSTAQHGAARRSAPAGGGGGAFEPLSRIHLATREEKRNDRGCTRSGHSRESKKISHGTRNQNRMGTPLIPGALVYA